MKISYTILLNYNLHKILYACEALFEKLNRNFLIFLKSACVYKIYK